MKKNSKTKALKNKIYVFAFERYYPNGGVNDLIEVYDTMEVAEDDWINHIKEEYFDGTIQMYDGRKIVKEFDYQTPDSKAMNTMQSVYIHRLPGDPDDAKGVMIKMDTSHDGGPWKNRQYYTERWAGIFGYNTGTEHIVPIYKIDGDQDITPEMTLRYENDYFVFYEKDDIYYSQVFIHGIKYIDSCKTKEEVNALAERAVKLFFDTPKKPCSK